MILDQSEWGHLRVTGQDRVRFMQGMCTADIAALKPIPPTADGAAPAESWTRASILNPKGRVLSVIELACWPEHILITCDPTIANKTLEILRKYAIMDDVNFEPVEQTVYRVWDSPQAVWEAAPIFAPLPAAAAAASDIECRRVEAGMPKYGADVDETCFPFESPLSRYIDYEKGCYLGQEPVSRVHHRGNPSRALRGLRVAIPRETDHDIAPGQVVAHPERAQAGTITSAAYSPTWGAIALAYLHRTVFAAGTEVEVAGHKATVVELPFT